MRSVTRALPVLAARSSPRNPGPGELLRACSQIAREIRSGYTIGYVPPDHDGTYHHVRIQVEPTSSRRLNVRTRPGYFAAGAPDNDD